jgi:hypothetical protein
MMRIALVIAALLLRPAASFAGAPEVCEQLKSLAGEWEADLPGFGKLAPHMRSLTMTISDRDHYSEKWTKTENGKQTEFDLNFVRR